MPKNWIQGMHMKEGALTKQAASAGKSPMEFAKMHAKSKGVTGKRSRLALTFAKMRKGK